METRAVGVEDLNELARLFEGHRNTRHCWCTAFCTTRTQLALGWFGGGNRRRFKAITHSSPAPMGVLVSVDQGPIGWAACGPRSRYLAATDGREPLLRQRSRDEDETVWLLPCLFVAAAHRGRGLTRTLVAAAVELARDEGAAAIESWPVYGPDSRAGNDFLGRASTFAAAGFREVDRTTPGRVLMRLDLTLPSGPA